MLRTYKIVFLVLVFIFSFNLVAFAESSSNASEKSFASIARESNFSFTKLDFNKLFDAISSGSQNLWELAQAFTWPILIGSLVLGFIFLFLGAVLGVFSSKLGDSIKGAGGLVIILGILKFVLINFAPEIAEGIITGIQNFFVSVSE
jgi:hypothetical protein